MEAGLETIGVAPYDPDAPMRVFRVSFPCDELDCTAQREAIAVRKSDTSLEQLLEEKKKAWSWANLKCPLGHEYSMAGSTIGSNGVTVMSCDSGAWTCATDPDSSISEAISRLPEVLKQFLPN
jgi:hypothetical protein